LKAKGQMMYLSLSPSSIELIIRSLSAYSSNSKRVLDDHAYSDETKRKVQAESIAALDLIDDIEGEMLKSAERQNRVEQNKVDPYNEWSPNDPRNW